jgi:hypothetical protein
LNGIRDQTLSKLKHHGGIYLEMLESGSVDLLIAVLWYRHVQQL